jgi:hypothetical protein
MTVNRRATLRAHAAECALSSTQFGVQSIRCSQRDQPTEEKLALKQTLGKHRGTAAAQRLRSISRSIDHHDVNIGQYQYRSHSGLAATN